MKEEYIPFGDEWRAEMSKMSKRELIEFLRKELISNQSTPPIPETLETWIREKAEGIYKERPMKNSPAYFDTHVTIRRDSFTTGATTMFTHLSESHEKEIAELKALNKADEKVEEVLLSELGRIFKKYGYESIQETISSYQSLKSKIK